MTDGPLTAYRALLTSGKIRPDPAQALLAEKLQSLHKALSHYQPAQGLSGWMARFGRGRLRSDKAPQGLYICGGVGGGKSMLMDIFYRTVAVEAKRRVHFHDFMREVHEKIHAWRQDPKRQDADPMPHLAEGLVRSSWLLCLDELEVRDITDAMIVGRLFKHLFDAGAVVVTTSNRYPDDLYKDGLQRGQFLPFIALIKERLDVLMMETGHDYRLGRIVGMRVYHTPLGDPSQREMDASFSLLVGDVTPKPAVIEVKGRSISIPLAAHGVARFSFKDLCGKPLGASDYLQIATLYPTVLVDDIPALSPENLDEARRFVILIDALYEHKVMLICSANAPPESLYPSGKGSFEFQRTVSRLIEMQSEDYLGLCHLT